jgi:hypothetical protein
MRRPPSLTLPADEKGGLAKKHDAAGILSMANSGKNSNTRFGRRRGVRPRRPCVATTTARICAPACAPATGACAVQAPQPHLSGPVLLSQPILLHPGPRQPVRRQARRVWGRPRGPGGHQADRCAALGEGLTRQGCADQILAGMAGLLCCITRCRVRSLYCTLLPRGPLSTSPQTRRLHQATGLRAWTWRLQTAVCSESEPSACCNTANSPQHITYAAASGLCRRDCAITGDGMLFS